MAMNCTERNHPLVFVAGSLRAGTTLLRLMLDHHPQISNPGEFDFAFDHIGDNGEPPDVKEFISLMEENWIFRAQNLAINPTLSYAEIIRSFFAQKSEPSKIASFNIHRGFHKVPYYFREAKYIYLIRDPRDVALSSVAMGWAGNTYFAVDRVIASEQSWDRLKHELRSDQFIELKYEDLLADPEKALAKVCDFLAVPYSRAMLRYHENSSYGKVDPTLAYQWRSKMSLSELGLVESKCRELLISRGYTPSAPPEKGPGPFRKVALWTDNRVGRFRFNLRRYGLFLVSMDKLNRIVRNSSINRFVRSRMDAIAISHLK